MGVDDGNFLSIGANFLCSVALKKKVFMILIQNNHKQATAAISLW